MTSGGTRKGAGRPALPDKKKAISVVLPPGLIRDMDTRPESRGVQIEKAWNAYYGEENNNG